MYLAVLGLVIETNVNIRSDKLLRHTKARERIYHSRPCQTYGTNYVSDESLDSDN